MDGSTTNDVIVSIATAGHAWSTDTGTKNSPSNGSISQKGYGINPSTNITVNTTMSPEIAKSSPTPTPGRPPRPPNETVTRKPSLARSAFSKPKSRLIEPSYPRDMGLIEERTQLLASGTPKGTSPQRGSPRVIASSPKASPITPKAPLISGQGEDKEEGEEDEIYKAVNLQSSKRMSKKVHISLLIESLAFILLLGLLITSLTVHKLRITTLWSLAIWRWCVLVMVVFCGRLVTEWFITILVFLIERNFSLKRKVLYFIYGVKKSVQVFLWLALILLAWGLLFNHGVERSRTTTKILKHITMAIAGCLVGAGIWLLKTLFVKTVAVTFHVNRFFDRIQESLFHQYILQTLSGPPLMEMAENNGKCSTGGSCQLSFRHKKKGNKGEKEEVIDIDKLHKMNQEKVSALTKYGLTKVIRRTGLTTISGALDDGTDDGGSEQGNKEITSEWEAKMTAYQIFNDVAKHDSKYIDEDDLLRFMKKDEVDQTIPLFEGASATGKIMKSAFTKWVVNAYLERKSLAHSLNDTKTAVEELNKVLSGLVLIIIVIVWNLMMGFLTTNVLIFISSQLLLIVFMFGNTAKTVFEAIVFVFIMHPFDVGDRCVIDGVQMVVEEMNILTTIFLRYDNEKVMYPNSVLSTKPISNFYRSPEMSDSVEFAIDFTTTVETISALKARIKLYIDSKPQHWKPDHSLKIKEIKNMNAMKMALYVSHTINFQNMGEKGNRKDDLMWELKKILEDLQIKSHLLPQDVHVTFTGSPASTDFAEC